MTDVVGEAVVELRADVDRLRSDMDRAGDQAGRGFAGRFGKAMAGLGALAAGATAVAFLKGAVGEAREAQKVGAATTAIIKATGGAANIGARAVSNLAGQISKTSGLDDELIQKGANLILTFKNVRNEVGRGNDIFNRATQAATDLSAAGFGSVESASLQLGKALNDPIKGIAALSRSGVTFSQQQKDQITTLVESGKVLQAQKIILGEVEGQVGGVAAATATAGEKAAVAWGNIQESIGTLLLPALDAAANFFTGVIAPAVEGLVANASDLAPVFAGIGAAVTSVVSGFTAGAGGVSGFTDALSSVASAVAPVVAGIGGLVRSLLPTIQSLAAQFVSTLLPGIQSIAAVVSQQFLPAFVRLLPILQPVARFLLQMFGGAVIGLIGGFIQAIRGVVQVVSGVVNLVVALIHGDWSAAWRALGQIVTGALNLVIGAIKVWWNAGILAVFRSGIRMLAQSWRGLWTGLKNLATQGASLLGNIVQRAVLAIGRFFLNGIRSYLQIWVGLWRTFLVLARNGWGLIRSAFSAGVLAVRNLVIRMAQGVRSLVTGMFDFLIATARSIPGRLAALGGRFLAAGRSIITSFVNGLKNAGGVVSGIAGNVWDAVRGMLNGAISRINAALSFTINPPGPGSISVNPPDIPHLARGATDFRGGYAVVGEHGRELVDLPRGSRVLGNAQTESRLGGGNNAEIHVHLPTGDPEAVAAAIASRWVLAGVV